jgi:type I restriction enzyme S subunit
LTWLQSGNFPELALYLYLWIDSPIGQGAVLASTIGTSQKALPIDTLKKVKIIKPPEDILEMFFEKVMPCIELKRRLRKQSQNLVRQRDLLLPRLMSGKLEVRT